MGLVNAWVRQLTSHNSPQRLPVNHLTMLAYAAPYRGALSASRRSLACFLPGSPSLPLKKENDGGDGSRRFHSAMPSAAALPLASSASGTKHGLSPRALAMSIPAMESRVTASSMMISTRTIMSSSSFSSLPPEEEQAEKLRVEGLSQYQKEMELRKLDADLSRLNTLRAINTGELYTFRGKFKMLSRDYGMGFLAWYWTCWFATAGLSYAAIELGGVDPLMVAAKVESFIGLEPEAITGKLDPTIGQIGLVVAVNECLEPLRLPFVVVTTKPVVNAFSKAT